MKAEDILGSLENAERMIGPLRERAVLAEAVCEAVLETMDKWDLCMHPKLQAALKQWQRKVPR